MKIAVVGLGLIGGSIAKALSGKGYECYGIDADTVTVKKAIAEKAIISALKTADLKNFDITIICLKPSAAIDFIKNNITKFKKGGILTDVCGIKSKIIEAVDDLCYKNGINFVPAHPMAGREKSGYGASTAELFKGANFIITPTHNTDNAALSEINDLALKLGCVKVIICTSFEHDEIIAYTSQLAHVVSNAYLKSPLGKKEKGFSADSYKDMTRVGNLNVELWSELFLNNGEELIKQIEILVNNINNIKDSIKSGDLRNLSKALLTKL